VTLAGLGLIGLCLFTGAARRELAFVEKIGIRRTVP
jgi:Ca2+/H+ antiporter